MTVTVSVRDTIAAAKACSSDAAKNKLPAPAGEQPAVSSESAFLGPDFRMLGFQLKRIFKLLAGTQDLAGNAGLLLGRAGVQRATSPVSLWPAGRLRRG